MVWAMYPPHSNPRMKGRACARRRPHRQCSDSHRIVRVQLGALHRALHELIKVLIEKEGFAPERLSAAGFAEFHPIAENSSPRGQQMNRRVDIVVQPEP